MKGDPASPQGTASETARDGTHGARLTYVLITPARNEEAYIEQTIRSVVSQTVRPAKWVIVSDGSTDRTDDIVKKYTAEHDWIELVRMPEHRDRSFAAKVVCFNSGYGRVRHLAYDLIGNLDADISFEEDYFSFLLAKFAECPELGVGGTPFREGTFQYDYRFTSIEHVSGACQLFRRECFESIGGYVQAKRGIDLIAVLTARMKGWKTRTYTEKTCLHHRSIGSATHGGLMARFRDGQQDYVLGGHPVWQIFRSLYQVRKKPVVVGGCALLWGYMWSALTQAERPIPSELVAFRRKEQMRRLRQFLAVAVTPGGRAKAK